ncbi:hypothetical protein BDZ94DRAFT_1268123 [Collybia nuda]|uniref:Uncharacterized protein n=1 Tax=Collybia nuda TaxID=64659 RepID=A0A9P6CEU3_9AGAR|nr:hypothetical protein BDZ94DRAFT_1268123 [Collybia nuda]
MIDSLIHISILWENISLIGNIRSKPHHLLHLHHIQVTPHYIIPHLPHIASSLHSLPLQPHNHILSRLDSK